MRDFMNNASNTSVNANTQKHSLSLEQRGDCKLTGIVEVHSFDENMVVLDSVEGMITMKGTGLHVSRLNLEKGEADVDGRVDSIVYSQKNSFSKKGEGILTRLFS